MSEPQEFDYRLTKDGKILITHAGRQVMTLTGPDARRLSAKLIDADAAAVQLALAKVTGNFKRGNERLASERARGKRGG